MTPRGREGLPAGIVTFLLTDVESSTRLWEEEGPEVARAAIARHYDILDAAVRAHGGHRPEEQGEGDSLVAVFARPVDAARCAIAAQAALAAEQWPSATPLRVRMALHTGEAQLRDAANYAGTTVIRAARVRGLARGGQILASAAARDLCVDAFDVDFVFRPLGLHALRGLDRPEHVWQLEHPSLTMLAPTAAVGAGVGAVVPTSLGSFIGRRDEITTLTVLVGRERLVTVTGAGGSGKTRLAQEVAGALGRDGTPAVRWVELAARRADAVEGAIRDAFDVADALDVALDEAVRRSVGEVECLLVLDNCEHVIDVVADAVDAVLRACPSVRVLATSRMMLDIPGELAWRVPPLSVPDVVDVDVDAVARADSVRLFADRAARVHAGFALTTDVAPVVAEICRRLDGVPLAIELAAARCRMLTPHAILDGLDDAFQVLAGGSRRATPRQQTIEASIAWSHELLSPLERSVLHRLSVFVDGWFLDAAQQVCAGDGMAASSVFEVLNRLVDHSLVRADVADGAVRFSFLETVRQFAAQELARHPDDLAAARERHARHYADELRGLAPRLQTTGVLELLAHLGEEAGNFDAAYSWFLDHGDLAAAIEMLDALLREAMVAKQPLRLRRNAFAALDRREVAGRDRARVATIAAIAATGCGYFSEATELLENAIELAASLGDRHTEARGRYLLAFRELLFRHDTFGDLDLQAEVLEELGDLEWATRALGAGALGAAIHGNLLEARVRTDRALAALGERDDPLNRSHLALVAVVEALFSARPALALDRYTQSVLTPFVVPALSAPAVTFAVQAASDLGDRAAMVVAIERLRESTRRHGTLLHRTILAAVEADLAVFDDRLDDAAAANERMVEGCAAMGLAPGPIGQDVRYPLAAAGCPLPPIPDLPRVTYVVAREARVRAELALRAGDLAAATRETFDALHLEADQRAERSLLFSLELLARLDRALGESYRAARILGCCDHVRAQRAMRRVPVLQRLVEETASALQASLGPEEWTRARAEGAALDVVAMADHARRLRRPNVEAVVGWAALTPTEARVATLVIAGHTNATAGRALLMSPETVKTHLSRVFAKVGVANRHELLRAAAREGRI